MEKTCTTEKCCTKCGERRPLEEFRPNVRYKGGFINWCLGCDKAYHQEWYQRTKERRHQQEAAYRALNPHVSRLAQQRYRVRHPDRTRASSRRWLEAHPGHATARRRDYNRRIRAVEDGKVQFSATGHFLLVRSEAGYWHAMLPGRPIGRKEQIVARYIQLRIYSDGQITWTVVIPDVPARGTEKLLRQLVAREKRLATEVEIKQLEFEACLRPR